MIGEGIKTEVTLEELRRITWVYGTEDIVGLYHGEVVRGFLFDVIECEDVNPLLISRCNVAEGWVEYIDVENPDAVTEMTCFFNGVKRDEHGDLIYKEKLCKVVVNLFDAKGNLIVTLR